MVWKIFRRLRHIFIWVVEASNRIHATLTSKLANGRLYIGSEIYFHAPARLNGLGLVTIDDGCHIGYRLAPKTGNGELLLQARAKEAVIRIGKNCWLSNNITIIACQEVTIGCDSLIGDGVMIFDSDFHAISPGSRHISHGETAGVHIGNNVWLGSRAMILKGVTIGSGSVVAPMSVVTKNVPENTLVAGIPAKVIREIV